MPRQHDGGPKTVLGRKGNWSGDDIPGILLDQPACAEWICRKLFRYFVSEFEDPSEALLAPLARAFRESGYQIRVPVAMILRSNLFFDASVRRRRVKCPVEFAVGTIRSLEVVKPTVQAAALARSCVQMGQSLYAPPSVAGWEWGRAWINSATLLARANLCLALLSDDDEAMGRRCNPAEAGRPPRLPPARRGHPVPARPLAPRPARTGRPGPDPQGPNGEGRRWRCRPARRGATYPQPARVSTGVRSCEPIDSR